MRKFVRSALVLAALGACSTRPEHPHPFVPPETQYSTGSTLAAAGGLMAAAVGSSLAQDPGASKAMRTAGTATAAAGAGMMAASLLDAIEVQKNREKFFNLTRAFYHFYFGGSSWGEEGERPAPPPIPELPFKFRDEDSPAPGSQDP